MIAFFYVPKQEKGGGKACSFRGTAWVSCWGPAWSGQGTVELFISLPGLVLFISTILQVYTFTLGWINYLTHSILQLKGEYLIAGKQMALPFWVCSTRTKKKKKITGLQPYSHRLRSCQIPSAREIWIWWLVSNGIFQGQKKKKQNQHPLFIFCTSLATSAYHERKEKFSPCQSFLLMIPVYPQLCCLALLLQPSFFPPYCKYFNSILFIDK